MIELLKENPTAIDWVKNMVHILSTKQKQGSDNYTGVVATRHKACDTIRNKRRVRKNDINI